MANAVSQGWEKRPPAPDSKQLPVEYGEKLCGNSSLIAFPVADLSESSRFGIVLADFQRKCRLNASFGFHTRDIAKFDALMERRIATSAVSADKPERRSRTPCMNTRVPRHRDTLDSCREKPGRSTNDRINN
jgi:hypothetical protein